MFLLEGRNFFQRAEQPNLTGLGLFSCPLSPVPCPLSDAGEMLPAPAVFLFPWEMKAGLLEDGAAVRTFGRLSCYRPEESRAVLTCHHGSEQHRVSVQTAFVEPFDPVIGAQYIALGEIDTAEGCSEAAVRARVLNCVDGVDIALLQKAINEQRKFFKERDDKAGARKQPAVADSASV